MIAEDPGRWLKPVFQFHQSDTFRRLFFLLVGLGIYTGVLAYIELDYMHLRESHPLKNITLMHSLLGFAISMLLVFRTNTAYERWWEGRKLWGALVNCSRNLAVKLHTYLPADQIPERQWFGQMIGLFANEMRTHLLLERTRLSLDERPHPEIPDFDRAKHVPIQVVTSIMQRLNSFQKNGHLNENQMLLINNDVTAFLDICGACERIKNTPIPYSYTAFIKKFIVAYSLTLPLGFVFVLSWLSIPVVVFVFYVLASLELIAEQIEDPFGYDAIDLPMDRLCKTISSNMTEILG